MSVQINCPSRPGRSVIERWLHADHCRRWVTIERDTHTDQVLGLAVPPGYEDGTG